MVPVDPEVYAQREQTVKRLGELGHIDPVSGEIPHVTQQGWFARINGSEFPVLGYEAGPTDDGRVSVMLAVAADSLVIGGPSSGVATPAPQQTAPPQRHPRRRAKKVASSWGSPGPDPREGIPGWTPPTDEPVQVTFTTGAGLPYAGGGTTEALA
jgi:hypothetical protein